MVSGRLRKKYGIEGDAREELYACADTWLTALGDRHFLGGETLLRRSFRLLHSHVGSSENAYGYQRSAVPTPGSRHSAVTTRAWPVSPASLCGAQAGAALCTPQMS